ncbi:MAG: hypothetical protein QM790_16885 [Nibricoccus sp.]
MGSSNRFRLRNYGEKSEFELQGIVGTLMDSTTPDEAIEPVVVLQDWEACLDGIEAHPKPWSLLGDEQWFLFQEKLGWAKDVLISEVAVHLDRKWPSKLKEECVGDYLAYDRAAVPTLERMGRVKLSTLACVLTHLVKNPNFGTEELADFDEMLRCPQLRSLDAMESDILWTRLLKPEPEQVTLEAIARQHGVTRERIRQVEASLLKSIKRSRFAEQVRNLRKRKEYDIFSQLADGELVISEGELLARTSSLSGAILLAIYIDFGSVREWLNSCFIKRNDCWTSTQSVDWEAIQERLSKLHEGRLPLPAAIVERDFGVDIQQLRAWGKITGKGIVYSGYLLSGRDANQRRAAIAHSLAVYHNLATQPYLSLVERWPLPNDPRKDLERAVVSAIRSAPSLFVSSSNSFVPRFASTSLVPLPPAPCESSSSGEQMVDSEDASSEMPSVERLDTWIQRKGPITVAELKSIREQWPEDARIAYSSLGVFLTQSRSIFMRLAPGLYERQKSYPDPERIEMARKKLLDPNQVKQYCLARLAGEEPSTLFPLWDNEQELRWIEWGEQNLSPVLHESLLNISRPDRWQPAGNEVQISRWAMRVKSARWLLPLAKFSDPPKIRPSIDDIIILGYSAKLRGSTSWIRANQLVGSGHVHERGGYVALALAVGFGFIEAASSPWKVHYAADNNSKVWERWENIITNHPHSCWDDPWIQAAMDEALQACEEKRRGWLTAADWRLIVDPSAILASPTPDFSVLGEEDDLKI